MRMLLCAAVILLAPARLADAAAEGGEWRAPDPENLLILELDVGEILIELNPIFAPEHVAQVQRLARDGFYDGRDFYRVIEGFVAQGGAVDDIASDGDPAYFLDAEFWIENGGNLSFTPVDRDDPFAPETGFVDGFPAARDPETGLTWLVHCPRAVAMARGADPDSGSTDFYIVLGHAPRYLDRNLTIFGRVVSGQRIAQRIARGERRENGVIENPQQRTKIRSARIAADLEPQARPGLQVQRTDSPVFLELLENRRRRDSGFFVARPPQFLDICSIPVETRLTAEP
ncbi:MAG: peptidylprolyl isomerase [Parvularculaceae bacterium]